MGLAAERHTVKGTDSAPSLLPVLAVWQMTAESVHILQTMSPWRRS